MLLMRSASMIFLRCWLKITGDYTLTRQESIDDRTIIGTLVGNENVAQLGEVKRLIRKIKTDAQNIPVSTSQENATWLNADVELVSMVDFIAANIYPTWCWTSNSAKGAPAASCGISTPREPNVINCLVAR